MSGQPIISTLSFKGLSSVCVLLASLYKVVSVVYVSSVITGL